MLIRNGLPKRWLHFLQTAGPAAQAAAQDVIEKGRRIEAHLLEVSDEDLEFSDADFVVAGTDRRVTLGEVAAAAHDPDNLPDEIEPGLVRVIDMSSRRHEANGGRGQTTRHQSQLTTTMQAAQRSSQMEL
jgi:CO/xanthine dehydrogenase Mo-binding subunit